MVLLLHASDQQGRTDFILNRTATTATISPQTRQANGRIGKYQIATYSGPNSSVYCLMVDTESGELWSWGPGGNQKAWEKVLPEPRRTTATAVDQPITGDLVRLQGTWTGSDEVFHFRWTINGNISTFDNTSRDGNNIGLTGRITVNDRARPHKTIDETVISRYGGAGGGVAPVHVLGIYEFIDENTIRINNGFNNERPTEFGARNSWSSGVFALKRKTKGDETKN
jgi:hypothetical protein